MIKTNKKNKIMALVLTMAMVFSMGTTVMAANVDASAPKYTINMAAVTDQQMRDSQVSIRFEFEGKEPVVIKGDDYMGYPVLMNVPSLGGVTLIPIRLICEAIGVPVDWVSATETDAAHALIKSPDHGDVKLYMGATSIEAADGTTYQETTYTFPDGSPIPLCMYRSGRTYVPVRFITSFLVKNATFNWSQNMQTLTIKGSLTEQAITNAWDGVGVNINKFWDPENPLDGMPNTAAVGEKYGNNAKGYGYAVAMDFVNVDTSIITDGLVLNGFGYSSNEPDRYETAIAMLKDVLDAESASALIKWIEKLDSLNKELRRLIIEEDLYYGDAKYDSVVNEFETHAGTLNDYTTMGNIQVRFAREGNNIMFLIKNK